METTLLSLPWQVQLSLASGYAAYHVANVGARLHHKTVDVAFSTLLFGSCATVIYNIIVWTKPDSFQIAIVSAIAAFVLTTLLGAVWRKWGRPFLKTLLRKFEVSFSDDDPSVLATLSMDTAHRMSQIAVKLDDGTWLRCDNTEDFAASPFGPCMIGQNGDVALYLTHVDSANGAEKELVSTKDNDFGDRLSYVPASRITQINVRYMKSL